MNPYLIYVERKAAWLAAHADATPAQIEAEAKRLAEQLGI